MYEQRNEHRGYKMLIFRGVHLSKKYLKYFFERRPQTCI